MTVHEKTKPKCIKCGGEVRWVTTALQCLKCGETGTATGWAIQNAGTPDEEIVLYSSLTDWVAGKEDTKDRPNLQWWDDLEKHPVAALPEPSALVCDSCGSNFIQATAKVKIDVEVKGYHVQDQLVGVLAHLEGIDLRCKNCGRQTYNYTLMLRGAGELHLVLKDEDED